MGHDRSGAPGRRGGVACAAVFAVLAAVLGGCFADREVTEEQVRAEQYQRVAGLAERLSSSTLVRADEFAREAIYEGGFDLVGLDGDSRYRAAGVRLVLQTGPHRYGDLELPEMCFEIQFTSEPVVWPRDDQYAVTEVACPEGDPLVLPPPRWPLAGVADRLAGVLADLPAATGGLPETADVRAVVAALELDPLVEVDVGVHDGKVGVGLRYGYTHACVQARVWSGQVEVWELSHSELRFAPRCTASAAVVGRVGIDS